MITANMVFGVCNTHFKYQTLGKLYLWILHGTVAVTCFNVFVAERSQFLYAFANIFSCTTEVQPNYNFHTFNYVFFAIEYSSIFVGQRKFESGNLSAQSQFVSYL